MGRFAGALADSAVGRDRAVQNPMAVALPHAARVAALFAAAERDWQAFLGQRVGFHTYVHADWAGALPVLRALRPRADSFLEFGSGLGVITILADLLGYDAYGIELDPWLHARSQDLADASASGAVFAHGSFVPDACRDSLHENADFLTVREGEAAYRDLGLDLADFDLVYAFPWPGEEERFLEMVRTCGRRDALLLLYGASDGYQLFQRGRQIPLPTAQKRS